MKQYISGAIIDDLSKIFLDEKRVNNFEHLSKWVSHFNLNSRSGFEENSIQNHSSEIAVLINILQRGIPTNLQYFALDYIVSKTVKLTLDDIDGEIIVSYNNLTQKDIELFFSSLHIIDPRINSNAQKEKYNVSGKYYGSEFEEDFIFKTLPNLLDKTGSALALLLTDQRLITNIISGKKEIDKFEFKVRNNFTEQRTDFSIEFPYYEDNKPIGIVVEIDGAQHHENPQQVYLDTERDKVVVECGWHNTLRINTSDFGNNSINSKVNKVLIPAINNEYVNNCINNYINPIWDNKHGKEIIQITLIPFAISRIQRSLLEAIGHCRLDISLSNWKIAIIERDVPCGELAINDFKNSINHLNEILKDTFNIPEIDLTIFSTKEFIESKFRESEAFLIDEYDPNEFYDLIIDISILERSSHQSFVQNNANEIINIRSINYIDAKRRLETGDLITYNHFCKLENNSGKWLVENQNAKNALEYFLKSIFRKVELKPGINQSINKGID